MYYKEEKSHLGTINTSNCCVHLPSCIIYGQLQLMNRRAARDDEVSNTDHTAANNEFK